MNPAQREAICTLQGPLMILAGAGSGKTRVLTHRIAHLIESGTALPGEIFAVTFTNKAAREMRERVEHILQDLGIGSQDVWISTFHSSGAKILRSYGGRIGLDAGFTIFDTSDQLSLIKDCMQRCGVSDKVVSPKAISWRLDQMKNDAIDPREFEPAPGDFFENKIAPVVKLYEEGLRNNNAVDFGDLVFKTYQLFLEDEALRERFQDQYRYVMVDEYQDTNACQYKLLRLLSAKYRNLCVVGDEDQSIYRWRGADIRNILDFERDYPEAKVVKLEENYRSSGHIIRAAGKVIAHNTQRKDKTLFTSQSDGDQVQVHIHSSDQDEAKWVVKQIEDRVKNEGSPASEQAILYRTNAQSRLLEDWLRYSRLPYRVYGGLKFYERAEVKDAISLLRVFVNPRDDISLDRIINVPPRGIGKQTIDACKEYALRERVSLLEAVGALSRGDGELGSAPRKRLGEFLALYARIQAKLDDYAPREFYSYMLDETGYVKALENENTVESNARLENLRELATVLAEYEQRSEQTSVAGFLQEIALYTDFDKKNDDGEAVTLMTLHSAKGLEFNDVYMVGLEEDLFPSTRAMESEDSDFDGVEEERRLCYVGMTRARKRLAMTAARMRRVFGTTQIRSPSRFLTELPRGEIDYQDHARGLAEALNNFEDSNNGGGFWNRSGASAEGWKARAASRQKNYGNKDYGDFSQDSGGSSYGGAYEVEVPAGDNFKVGAKVRHPDFGAGTIMGREGSGDSTKVRVKFDRVGLKKFVLRFAPLEVV